MMSTQKSALIVAMCLLAPAEALAIAPADAPGLMRREPDHGAFMEHLGKNNVTKELRHLEAALGDIPGVEKPGGASNANSAIKHPFWLFQWDLIFHREVAFCSVILFASAV